MYLVGLLLLGGWCFFRAVADCDDHFVCGWLLAAAGCDVLVVAVSSWLRRPGVGLLVFLVFDCCLGGVCCGDAFVLRCEWACWVCGFDLARFGDLDAAF